MAAVELRGVRKAFGRTAVIHGIDLEIRDNEFMVFVGPSGCGKSTLLRLIAGLEDADGGDILIGGAEVNDVPPAGRGIAMVFQSYALYPHMSVYENMAFGLTLARTARHTVEDRVRAAARTLRIEDLLHRKPRELSGGQRQRVAIGRAIVREPRVFLFDEPLSNLDAALRVAMRIEIAELRRQIGATMVYVTHDQVEAMTLADRIAVLNAGRLEQVGTPMDLYHHPANTFVAGFLGSPRMNLLAATVTDVNGAAVTAALPGGGRVRIPVIADGVSAGDGVTLGVRPQHTVPAGDADAVLPGTVFVVERLGAETFCHVRLADGQAVVTQAAGDVRVAAGDPLAVGIAADTAHLFTGDGRALPRHRRHPLAEPPAPVTPAAAAPPPSR
ncbi:ABC transporter ATP-binding protein [Azospirillum halopraeferens]|uniref:ABC transporter ATP-binding protein n=1 Tax=Azospirillum halopraeferens TaxID=34010 RepID=UPI000429BFCA|nr:sn-glycerol-3-phosphate ABC transporter ATP-binding protein UgpC [Azospirillum halopraeferens]